MSQVMTSQSELYPKKTFENNNELDKDYQGYVQEFQKVENSPSNEDDIPEEICGDIDQNNSYEDDIAEFDQGIIFERTQTDPYQMIQMKKQKKPTIVSKIDFLNKDAKMSFNISLTKDSLFFQGTQFKNLKNKLSNKG